MRKLSVIALLLFAHIVHASNDRTSTAVASKSSFDYADVKKLPNKKKLPKLKRQLKKKKTILQMMQAFICSLFDPYCGGQLKKSFYKLSPVSDNNNR